MQYQIMWQEGDEIKIKEFNDLEEAQLFIVNLRLKGYKFSDIITNF